MTTWIPIVLAIVVSIVAVPIEVAGYPGRSKMQKVRMDKSKVLDRVTANRAHHEKTYNQAMVVYRERAIKELKDLIDALKAGKSRPLTVRLPIPKDYTSEYDLVIDMLNNSVDDVVELDDIDFRKYIRDEWDWKTSFRETTSVYAVS